MRPAHPVKIRRVVLGMTQDDLARVAGVDKTTIGRIEAGKFSRGPQRVTRRRVAKALSSPQDWLFPPKGGES